MLVLVAFDKHEVGQCSILLITPCWPVHYQISIKVYHERYDVWVFLKFKLKKGITKSMTAINIISKTHDDLQSGRSNPLP